MTYFRQQIFLGGQNSDEDVAILKMKLEEAITLLGGLQRPTHPKNYEEGHKLSEQMKEDEIKLQSLAEEIYIALTGNGMDFY
jgi:hypothetical protein